MEERESSMGYDQDNIFAKILRGEAPAHSVYEDELTMAFLDVMPQADGHTLVLPKAPSQNLFELPDEAAGALLLTVRKVAAAVKQAFAADGIQLQQFNGSAAGQTVFHLHFHIIPCHTGRARRRHATAMADAELLKQHAQQIRAALGSERAR